MDGVNTTVDEQALLEKLNTEVIIENIPTMVYISVINILGITGNILTILFNKTKKLTNSSLLITVLAIIDLSTCFLLFNQIIFFRFTFTFTSDVACTILLFLSYWFLSSSVSIMFLICVERHRKLCRPFGWQFSIRSCKWTIAGFIALASVWNAKHIPLVSIAQVNLTASDGTRIIGYSCLNLGNNEQSNIATLLHTSDMVAVVLIVALFVILYLHIGRTILKSRKKLKMSFGISQGLSKPPSSTCIRGRVVETSNNKVKAQVDTKIADDGSSKIINIQAGSHDTGGTPDCEIICETTNLQDKIETQDQGHRISENDLNDGQDDIKTRTKSVEKAYVHKVEQKMTLISIMITLGYILSFIPYFIVGFYVRNRGIEYYELGIGMQIALRSYLFNSAINPFIIGYFNDEFRKYIKGLLYKGRHCLK